MKQINDKQIKNLIELIKGELVKESIELLENLDNLEDIKDEIRKLIRNSGRSNFIDKEELEEAMGDY